MDGRRLEAGTLLRTDICIVGAGPAGITLALELAAWGREVLLLESGGLTPARETQSLLAGDSGGSPFPPLDEARLACLGGTTAAWTGWCRPLDPLDFECRDWVPHSGWPFDAAHLEPFYRRAHGLCGLGDWDYAPSRWADGQVKAVDPGGEIATAVFQLSPRLDFGRAYRGRLAADSRVACLLRATALELEPSPSGDAVRAVRVALPGPKDIRVEAGTFVLAAGGIENPRLLLLSDRRTPAGIGNRHGLVGRFFMEHPYVNSGLLHASAGEGFRFYAPHRPRGTTGLRVSGVFSLPERVIRRERLLNVAVFLRPAWRADAVYRHEAVQAMERLANGLRRGLPPAGSAGDLLQMAGRPDLLARAIGLRLGLRRGAAGSAALRAFTEPVPDPSHRVTLTDQRDPLGRRRVRVEWSPGALELRSLRRAHELLDQGLCRSGRGRLELDLGQGERDWPASLSGACHHIGTTRMHSDPRQGVADPDCRVHGMANLYLAGSSVFPTAGHANPTLTIVALALRLAGALGR